MHSGEFSERSFRGFPRSGQFSRPCGPRLRLFAPRLMLNLKLRSMEFVQHSINVITPCLIMEINTPYIYFIRPSSSCTLSGFFLSFSWIPLVDKIPNIPLSRIRNCFNFVVICCFYFRLHLDKVVA